MYLVFVGQLPQGTMSCIVGPFLAKSLYAFVNNCYNKQTLIKEIYVMALSAEEVKALIDSGMTAAQVISSELNSEYSATARLGMFVYGSAIYGNKKPSDIDVLVVLDTHKDVSAQYVIGDYNVTVVDYNLFVMNLRDHHVVTIECVYADPKTHLMPISPRLEHVIKSFKEAPTPTFGFSLGLLRSSFSKTSSNSYVKAKKKLTVPESYDLECSVKSMWHSIRILAFGATLARTGKIDFQEANELYSTILEVYMDAKAQWPEIHEIMSEVENAYSSDFKKVAPKTPRG